MASFHDYFSVLPALADLDAGCNAAGVRARWYLFGSYARGSSTPKDIDVLALTDESSHISILLLIAEPTLLLLPIHLTVMTKADERRRNFIKRTGAFRISDPG